MEEMEWQLLVGSRQETEQLAAWLGTKAWSGIVIALDGDLGAGKTTFSKGFAASLGVQEVVSSPTFTIIKEYEGEHVPFYHMDVYRLTLAEADELGLDDYFFGEGATIVEWASVIDELLPAELLSMYIEYIDEQQRMIQFKAKGARYKELLQKLQDWSPTHE